MLTLTPLTSHCGPGRDEQAGSQQESHEVWVGQPGAGTGPDLQHVVLLQLQDVRPARGQQSLSPAAQAGHLHLSHIT